MNWVFQNLDLIGELTLAHLTIAVPAIVLSFVLSIPLGWIATRFRLVRGVLLTTLGLLYAIPSLPLFVALPVIIGNGLRDPVNVVIALTMYGVALMVRAASDGLGSIDREVTEAATAIGYSSWSRFWRVELPLSGPVLLAGIRVVSVSTVSLTTVAAVLGVKSLGLLFTDGLQRNIPEEVLAGIVMTIVIALVIDRLLVLVGRMLMPWSEAVARSRVERASSSVQVTA